MKEMTTYPKVCLDDLTVSSAKGSYILIMLLNSEKKIRVGSLGGIPFPEGFYTYLGSALGGFKSRVNRHLTEDKKPKWHIDYLLSEAKVLRVIFCETERRLECLLSQALVDGFSFIPGFGSSDCRCQSHLYFANDESSLKLGIRKAIAEIALPREFFMELTVDCLQSCRHSERSEESHTAQGKLCEESRDPLLAPSLCSGLQLRITNKHSLTGFLRKE